MNIVGQAIYKALQDHKSLNILSCSTHETYQSTLANCFPEYTFYNFEKPGLKTWNPKFRQIPKNVKILTNHIPLTLHFDILISQNKADQFQILAPLARQYNIPLIDITHTNAYPQMSQEQLLYTKSLKGDINLFISEFSKKSWLWDDNEGEILEHGIDTSLFKPANIKRKPYILSVCNQFSKPIRWQPCGFPLWQDIIKPKTNFELPWKHLGGDDPGFSEPAKDINDLIKHYQEAQIFINTTQLSPIPMSLLESAACGAAIVSTNTCAIPDIFTHEKDALLSNNPQELRNFCEYLLNNPTECERLGSEARKTIKQRFNLNRFKKDWERIFEKSLSL